MSEQGKQPKQKEELIIHNCHVHLFNIDYIPRYFIHPWVPVTLVKVKWLANFIYGLLKNKGWFNRYLAFLYSSLRVSGMEILQELQGYYPEGTRFVPLTVDFTYMKAGDPIRDFEQQVDDMAVLKAEYPDILFPFVGIDPRRPNLLEFVKNAIEHYKFTGLKAYPALGFFPDDPRLDPVYEYAVEKNLPITTHCIPTNKNHYRGKITDDLLEVAKRYVDFDEKHRKDKYQFAQYFNHPKGWERVLKKYPTLKVNFGHFGGSDEWNRYLDEPEKVLNKKYASAEEVAALEKNLSWYTLIRRLIKNPDYPNVYADISFTVHDKSLYPMLKNLMQHPETRDYVLFGSDFYMLQKDYRERRFGFDVRGYLNDEDYWQIADRNPRRFLSNAFREF